MGFAVAIFQETSEAEVLPLGVLAQVAKTPSALGKGKRGSTAVTPSFPLSHGHGVI